MSPPRKSVPASGVARRVRSCKGDRSAAPGADAKTPLAPAICFAPEILGDLNAAEQREWLVTNGLGGFASGTIAGSSTRRYHGLLIAALSPPAARTQLVGALDEIVSVDGNSYELATHRWLGGTVSPQGHTAIESFRLDQAVPVWVYRAGSARVEKRIWMRYGENTTFIRYALLESHQPVALALKMLVNYRDFHASTHAGNWRMRIDAIGDGLRVSAFDNATPFYLRSQEARAELQHTWYRNFLYTRENERGLDDYEDLLLAGIFRATLEHGQSVTIVVSTRPDATVDGSSALNDERTRQAAILEKAKLSLPDLEAGTAPLWLSQLVFAADQFLVRRPLPDRPDAVTVIAGYHWFGDWGRDTMIVLPGLALATGRAEIAREILLAFSAYVDRGILPNNFPDLGGSPGYNTIDATLWYFEAIRQYFAASNDLKTLETLFPVLLNIVDAHVNGTRYNIHADSADGLLYGGGPGVQLTWMDAKIGDWVVTPRTGKPVEINALWINALESMAQFARQLHQSPDVYQQLSARAKSGFQKFWNAERNCCFDVIDCPARPFSSDESSSGSKDPSVRPNQIFAVSLPFSPLTAEQQRAVVDACLNSLLTPFGLRSLAPSDPAYKGMYSGGVVERDSAYHQGPAWGWLLGPFALAHYRVYGDRTAARAFLAPLGKAIDVYGLGSLAEIFDGDSPHHPRGCIAQAWSVAELLRAWQQLRGS